MTTDRSLSAVFCCWLLLCCALAGGPGTTGFLRDSETVTGAVSAGNGPAVVSQAAGNRPGAATGPPTAVGNTPSERPGGVGNTPWTAGNDNGPPEDRGSALIGSSPANRARVAGAVVG